MSTLQAVMRALHDVRKADMESNCLLSHQKAAILVESLRKLGFSIEQLEQS